MNELIMTLLGVGAVFIHLAGVLFFLLLPLVAALIAWMVLPQPMSQKTRKMRNEPETWPEEKEYRKAA